MRDPSRMRRQTYCYAAGTHEHPNAIFRGSHRRRFDTAVRLLDVRPGCRVLDYGSGDGFLVQLLLPQLPASDLTALEPLPFLQEQFRQRFEGVEVRLAESSRDLPSGSFDRIACLEVLEHLRPPEVETTLRELERLLAPGGILVVSVPIEIGPSVLVKYLAARVITRMDRWYTPREVFRSTLGLPVERDAEGSFLSHRGYDHRATRAALSGRFVFEKQRHSPLPWLRGALNAQVFWKLRLRQEGRDRSG
jgi:SAM-dependent methyltransferase